MKPTSNTMNFRLKGRGWDARKKYTIKVIRKNKMYYGGYKVEFNETTSVIGIGIFIDEFKTSTRIIEVP